VFVEPRWQRLGEIVLPNGKKHFFLRADIGVNSSSSTAIAQDKSFTQYMLQRAGIRTPEGQAFSSERMNAMFEVDNGINKAVEYARTIGYPVFVKPNDLDYGEYVVRSIPKANSKESLCPSLSEQILFWLKRPVRAGITAFWYTTTKP
jgi:phosphoribosylamine-glycine ligase